VSVDREGGEEGFLRRWSRVKSEAREDAATPAAPPPQPKVDRREPEVDACGAEPTLPPLDQLTLDSDFTGFFHPKVDENLRRQALRKLFSDPHFNVMDGLDVYIDDYSKSEPIPAAMLAGLKQAQRILEWAAEKPAEKAADQRVSSDAHTADVEPATADAPQLQPEDPQQPISVSPAAEDPSLVTCPPSPLS
jgi:hypothetical protein